MFLGYRRGEPAWEWVQDKQSKDCQPFKSEHWTVVHNGTIANDKELRLETGHRPETTIDSAVLPWVFERWGFRDGLDHIRGSFAIIAYDARRPDSLFWAANYKPLWVLGGEGFTIASQRSYFDGMYGDPSDPSPIELGPYEWGMITSTGKMAIKESIRPTEESWTNPSALVICSGGLDSGTAAWVMHKNKWDVTLLHFMYSAKAEEAETYAVNILAQKMGRPAVYLTTDFFRDFTSSPLTDTNSTISGGEAGSEFAHEWVPARNTVMMAMAIAYAEAKGFDAIVIGTNQEESGAYPDNEQEFVNKWRALVPYAVKADYSLEIRDPFGPYMKKDIVRIGDEYNMPFELTWSCYHDGVRHCGKCGPCTMRRRAFAMNDLTDPTQYEQGVML
jgi:7-cyano-7-deazaguanine synthase